MAACIRLLFIAASAFASVLSASQLFYAKKQARKGHTQRGSNSMYSLPRQAVGWSSFDTSTRKVKRAKMGQPSKSSNPEALADGLSLVYTNDKRSEPLRKALELLASLPTDLIRLALSYAQISSVNPESLISLPLKHLDIIRFMVPGDLWVEIPVKDFKTCLLEYKDLAGNRADSEQLCTKLLPIAGLVDFAVCPEYKVFVTYKSIVTVWTNSDTTTTLDNPYFIKPPMKILSMSPKGLVLLLNTKEPGLFVLCNLKTGKTGYFVQQRARDLSVLPCVAMNSDGTLLSTVCLGSGLKVSRILESLKGVITLERIAETDRPMPDELTRAPIPGHYSGLDGCSALHFIGDSMLSVEAYGHVVFFRIDAGRGQLTRLPNSFYLPPRCCDALACAKLRRYSPLTNTFLMVNFDNSQASRILRMPLFNDIEALIVGLPHACQYNDGRPLKINALGSHCVASYYKTRQEIYIYRLRATDREIMDCLSEYAKDQVQKSGGTEQGHDDIV